MKKTILFISLILSLVACRKNSDPVAYNLGVDLHANFEQDHVQVYIDNQPLFNNEATTNHLVGLAGSISTTNTDGRHTIKVVVNGTTTTTENFEQHADLYIGIGYEKKTGKISFLYSAQPFGYD